MTTAQLKRRLDRVRLRWKLTAALRGLVLVMTEAVGMFLVFLLADWMYQFRTVPRLVLFGLGSLLLAGLVVRHVVYPLIRKISDEQIALLLEERSPAAEGAVLSAVEFGDREGQRTGLYGYIVGFLVDDAVRRIDNTNLRVVSNVGRLRKHLFACLGLLAVFAVSTLTFPSAYRDHGRRIVSPWATLEEERRQDQAKKLADAQQHALLYGPIQFEITPKDKRVVRNDRVNVVARLSRDIQGEPVTLVMKYKGSSDVRPIRMEKTPEADNRYTCELAYVNDDAEYYVEARGDQSDKYRISVYDHLAVRGIELTCHYPEYLQAKPETTFGPAGDVKAPEGTTVDFRIVTNNPLTGGQVQFEGKPPQALTIAKDATDGTCKFTVEKDTSYTFTLTDINGDTVSNAGSFFFVKAVPDTPPTIELACPKIDMVVSPVSEVTFRANVADDFGIASAALAGRVYHGEEVREFTLPLKVADKSGKAADNIRDGLAEIVLEMEKNAPPVTPGDMIFYHLEASDRKGQTSRSDEFFLKMSPLEVAAAIPQVELEEPDEPDALEEKGHLMLYIAAAWNLEQQRAKLAKDVFATRSDAIAGSMNGTSGELLIFKGSQLTGVKDLILGGQELLRKAEPGKATNKLRLAMAKIELAGLKDLQQIEMTLTQMAVAQPGARQQADPLAEQTGFRAEPPNGTTPYNQPVDDSQLLSPEYRRAIAARQQQKEKKEQLETAAAIAENQKKLIELAMGGDEGKTEPDNKKPQNNPSATDNKDPNKDPNKTPDNKDPNKTGDNNKDPNKDPNKAGDNKDPNKNGDNKDPNKNGPDEKNIAGRQKDLSEQTAALARKIVGTMDPDDKLAKEALDNLRAAAGKMNEAAEKFKAGEDNEAIAAANLAEKAVQGAVTRLQIAQYENLNAALNAAHDHAAALAANQEKIADATANIAKRVSELTGEGKPDDKKPVAQPATGPATSQPGKDDGKTYKPSVKAVDKAIAKDPRLSEQIKALAAAQGRQADEVKRLEDMVAEIQRQAKEAANDRLTGAVNDVGGAMKRDDTYQKTVDTKVDLAGKDVTNAQRSAKDAAKSLTNVVTGLEAANEMLAGTPTAMLREAARTSRQIGEAVARATGQEDKIKSGREPTASAPAKDPNKTGDNTVTKPAGDPSKDPTNPNLKTALTGDEPANRPQANKPGNEDIVDLWLKTKRLTNMLKREGLVDEKTAAFLDNKSGDFSGFGRMFDRAGKPEAEQFTDVMLGLAASLDEALKEALSSNRLASELKEECPPRYRELVKDYFKALSAAANR